MTSSSGAAPNPDAEIAAGLSLEEMVHHNSPEALKLAAQHPALNKELALALLARRDISGAVIEMLSKRGELMKHRVLPVTIASHPKAPRHIALPIVRRLYTFELMRIALAPVAPADIKMAAEEVIIGRLGTISSGERLTLARRSSSRVAAALLLDPEARIVEAALNNSRMVEAGVVKALMREEAPGPLIDLVCRHRKWLLRREVQIALLRNPGTPFGRLLQIVPLLPVEVLREALKTVKLSVEVHGYLERILAAKRQEYGRSSQNIPGSPQPGRE